MSQKTELLLVITYLCARISRSSLPTLNVTSQWIWLDNMYLLHSRTVFPACQLLQDLSMFCWNWKKKLSGENVDLNGLGGNTRTWLVNVEGQNRGRFHEDYTNQNYILRNPRLVCLSFISYIILKHIENKKPICWGLLVVCFTKNRLRNVIVVELFVTTFLTK